MDDKRDLKIDAEHAECEQGNMKNNISKLLYEHKSCIDLINKRLDEINKDISFVEKTLKTIPDIGVFRCPLDTSHRIDMNIDTECQEIIDFSNGRLKYIFCKDGVVTNYLVINCKASIRYGIWKCLKMYFSFVMNRLKEFSETI